MNRQARRIISTYAADTSGGVSALYELGGLSVIHDASGCGSTYTTHDEPRWYDEPSAVAITALTEMDAVMGNDEKIVRDILSAVEAVKPRFVSITSTPVPFIMNTDLAFVASLVEKKSGVSAWYLPSNGMRPYVRTVSSGLIAYLDHFVPRRKRSGRFSLNIVGATPLDFISQRRVDSIVSFLEGEGLPVCSTLAMGSSVESIARASQAWVNLAVSASGIAVSSFMERKYGIPWVTGLPWGSAMSRRLLKALRGERQDPEAREEGGRKVAVIGEGVQNAAIVASLPHCSCLSITPVGRVRDGDREIDGEEEIASLIRDADCVIADPLYKPIAPKRRAFIPFPHFAFSGRLAKDDGVDPVGSGLDDILEEIT